MFAQRRDVCAVSPKVVFDNDTIAYAGIALDITEKSKRYYLFQGQASSSQGYEAMLRLVRNTTSVWDGCCMFSKKAWEKLDGISEDVPGFELTDFSLKGIRNNMWNVWTCFAEVKYRGSQMDHISENSIKVFEKKWKQVLEKEDLYYNPYWKKFKLV